MQNREKRGAQGDAGSKPGKVATERKPGNSELPVGLAGSGEASVGVIKMPAPLRKHTTIFELAGRPTFRPPDQLSAEETEFELRMLLDSCEAAGIRLVIKGEHSSATIYRFITEEFLALETEELSSRDLRCFVYEDFHPCHRLMIMDQCRVFLSGWIKKNISDLDAALSEVVLTSRGMVRSKSQVLEMVNKTFHATGAFCRGSLSFTRVDAQWDEETASGSGNAEGMICYEAVSEYGKPVQVEGCFKCYLTNDNGSGNWEIFFFIVPGFNW